MRPLAPTAAGLLALALLAGCGDSEEPATADAPLQVAVAFYPVEEAARRVGGDRVEVTNLTPPGVASHDLELTPTAAAALEEADLVLYLGGGFQRSVERAVGNRAEGSSIDLLGSVDLRTVDDAVPGVVGEVDGTELAGRRDPHVWVDPARYAEMVEAVRDGLIAADPGDADTYRTNAEVFLGALRDLDRTFARELAGCRGRVLVTSHAAFGYLADRYGLRQAPIAARPAEPRRHRPVREGQRGHHGVLRDPGAAEARGHGGTRDRREDGCPRPGGGHPPGAAGCRRRLRQHPAGQPAAPGEGARMHRGLDHAALELRGVTVRYGRHVAVEDASFSIAQGELVALVGPNGAGKSTLFRAALGRLPAEGTIVVHETRRHGAAFVPQRPEVELDFPITVGQAVATGRRAVRGFRPWNDGHDRRAVARCLSRVGLDGLERRPIGALSGGQLQRVLIARALAQEPSVMLLDEPLSGVDAGMTVALVDLLRRLADEGTAIMVSTHDLALVRERFDRCIAINRRVVGDGPPGEVLDARGLERFFGLPALAAA